MTPKQRRFVSEYLKDQNATQAAVRSGYSKKSAGKIGHQLLEIPRIADAVATRQEKVAEKAEFTVTSHLLKLAELRDAAIAAGQISAAVKAEENRGKVAGFYVQRVEHSGEVTHVMTDEQREARILHLLQSAARRREQPVS